MAAGAEDASDRRRRAVPRWLAAALLLGYAAFASINGIDRMGSLGGDNPLRGTWTARRAAAEALGRGDSAAAAAQAIRALRADPVDPEVIGLLGWARLTAGDSAGAEAAFAVSGPMGWRDPYTQLYWMNRGLALGAPEVAAQRLDALLRVNPELPGRDPLFAAMTASVEGRAALAVRLAEAPQWGADFLGGSRDLPLEALANRLDVAQRTPSRALDCDAAGGMAIALVRAGLASDGEAIWRKACGAKEGLIHDGQFARFDPGRNAPRLFDWQVPASGDIALRLEPRGDTARTLAVRVRGAISQPVLRQAIVLPAGRYRLSWSMPDMTTEQALDSTRVALGCGFARELSAPGQPVPGRAERLARDLVLDDTCQMRMLVFWMAPGSDIRLADVQLERTGT